MTYSNVISFFKNHNSKVSKWFQRHFWPTEISQKSEWQKNLLNYPVFIPTFKIPIRLPRSVQSTTLSLECRKFFVKLLSSWNQLSIVGNTDLPWLVEILPLCEEKNKLLYISIQVCLAHCIKLISCLIHIRQNSKNQKVYSINL